jgi:hypothetical protein
LVTYDFYIVYCFLRSSIVDSIGFTPYDMALSSELPSYMLRLLLRAASEQDPAELRRMNYRERCGAMYLLYSASLRNERGMKIWHEIKKHADKQLFKEIVSFL